MHKVPTLGTAVIQSSRIDRASLDAADFPIRVEVPIRFDDLDLLGHVNNAAAAAILQEGRVGFNQHAALPALAAGLRPVVASLRIEFAAELLYPGVVEVCSGIAAIGRTSYTMAQVGRQNGQTALYGEVTLVVSGANGPVPIADDLRAAIEQLRLAGG
jgi:acyl-CoA thioester hydrolase